MSEGELNEISQAIGKLIEASENSLRSTNSVWKKLSGVENDIESIAISINTNRSTLKNYGDRISKLEKNIDSLLTLKNKGMGIVLSFSIVAAIIGASFSDMSKSVHEFFSR